MITTSLLQLYPFLKRCEPIDIVNSAYCDELYCILNVNIFREDAKEAGAIGRDSTHLFLWYLLIMRARYGEDNKIVTKYIS